MEDVCRFDPVAWINTPRWQASRLGLSRMVDLLERLGRPQDELRFMHVAGTNGKGSVCAYVASVLQAAGYKVGLFTSPFILCFEERIRVNGEEIGYRAHTYVMLHKPAGVLSATEDGRGETVLDLLAPEYRKIGLFPVGRLDKDTEGLLLLTDDGALAHDLLAPKRHVDKVYFARTDGALTAEDCAAFAAGITLGDGLECLPAKLEILESGAQSEALVTIHEGKFHQIKRMLASRGKPVVYLKRLSMGALVLDETLGKGEYRLLTAQEIENLRASGHFAQGKTAGN